SSRFLSECSTVYRAAIPRSIHGRLPPLTSLLCGPLAECPGGLPICRATRLQICSGSRRSEAVPQALRAAADPPNLDRPAPEVPRPQSILPSAAGCPLLGRSGPRRGARRYAGFLSTVPVPIRNASPPARDREAPRGMDFPQGTSKVRKWISSGGCGQLLPKVGSRPPCGVTINLRKCGVGCMGVILLDLPVEVGGSRGRLVGGKSVDDCGSNHPDLVLTGQ